MRGLVVRVGSWTDPAAQSLKTETQFWRSEVGLSKYSHEQFIHVVRQSKCLQRANAIHSLRCIPLHGEAHTHSLFTFLGDTAGGMSCRNAAAALITKHLFGESIRRQEHNDYICQNWTKSSSCCGMWPSEHVFGMTLNYRNIFKAIEVLVKVG